MKNSEFIATSYVKRKKKLADPFIKGLQRNVISVMSKNMGMRPIWSYTTMVTYPFDRRSCDLANRKNKLPGVNK
jgi:hypothetical protein